MPMPATRYSSVPMQLPGPGIDQHDVERLSAWPMRRSSASTSAAVTTCPSGRCRKSSLTPGRKNSRAAPDRWSSSACRRSTWIENAPGASMWVPLWVAICTCSIAQPSPSGRSSRRKPGNKLEQQRRGIGVAAVLDLRPHERRVEHRVVVERRRNVDDAAGWVHGRSGSATRNM